jgi:hypothetical protein
MLDPQVTQLLATGINTSCKLALMLRFAESTGLAATTQELANRICRDRWSVQQALDELVEDGLLQRSDNQYRAVAGVVMASRLHALRDTYDQPLQRLELQRLLRDLEQYAPYRKEFPTQLLLQRVA